MQLHVFHLKWKKCNYIHCSLGMKLRLCTNFRIALSTYLRNLLARFQSSCSPEAVVQNDFTAPGPMEVNSTITYSTLPWLIGFLIDALSNSHHRHSASVPPPAMQAYLYPTIIPSAKPLFHLPTLKAISNGTTYVHPDFCSARGWLRFVELLLEADCVLYWVGVLLLTVITTSFWLRLNFR